MSSPIATPKIVHRITRDVRSIQLNHIRRYLPHKLIPQIKCSAGRLPRAVPASTISGDYYPIIFSLALRYSVALLVLSGRECGLWPLPVTPPLLCLGHESGSLPLLLSFLRGASMDCRRRRLLLFCYPWTRSTFTITEMRDLISALKNS